MVPRSKLSKAIVVLYAIPGILLMISYLNIFSNIILFLLNMVRTRIGFGVLVF